MSFDDNGAVGGPAVGSLEECGERSHRGFMSMPEQGGCLGGVVDVFLSFKRTG